MSTLYTEEKLKNLNKDALVLLFLSQQDQLKGLQVQVELLNQKTDLLLEQLNISKQRQFGRSTEKLEQAADDYEQLELCFNEAEITQAQVLPEPELEDIIPKPYKRKKVKGKRDSDLEGLPIKVIRHEPASDICSCGGTYRMVKEEIYKRLAFHPAYFEVEEHHVSVCSCPECESMIRAERSPDLLRNSIATPSLVAGILNGKYVNAMPLYRHEQEFARHDVTISRQTMANWVIRCSENYLSLIYERMHEKLLECGVIQADETTVTVNKDGRKAGTNSYMWIYRSGVYDKTAAVVLYEYQKTRKQDHPQNFLHGYKGIIVSDGYQAYKNLPAPVTVCGCWAHCRRKYTDIVKALGKGGKKQSVAAEAVERIGYIYKIEQLYQHLEAEERQKKRKQTIEPLVDDYFVWVKQRTVEVIPESATGKALTYSINQEEYLRRFLLNGNIPLDNNACEQSIRPFTTGRRNWIMIDSIHGAQASAIAYSIAESAKANQLKPYEYFKYLLEEIPCHMEDKNLGFLDRLLPWADELPDKCKKTKT